MSFVSVSKQLLTEMMTEMLESVVVYMQITLE